VEVQLLESVPISLPRMHLVGRGLWKMAALGRMASVRGVTPHFKHRRLPSCLLLAPPQADVQCLSRRNASSGRKVGGVFVQCFALYSRSLVAMADSKGARHARLVASYKQAESLLRRCVSLGGRAVQLWRGPSQRVYFQLCCVTVVVAAFQVATPIVEPAELYNRGLGDTSDVVNKEMYTFDDRSGNTLTLRPEATASVVRALISEDIAKTMPQRLWYHGPMFRCAC